MYLVGADGIEHIVRFAIENWWITDDESYNTGNPTRYNVDALEETEVLIIKKDDLNALFKAIPKFDDLKNKLGAKRFAVSQSRILSNISDTAEEKYDNFIKSYPQFYERVPLHMIASYLGLSRETLSRVRKKYVKNNHTAK